MITSQFTERNTKRVIHKIFKNDHARVQSYLVRNSKLVKTCKMARKQLFWSPGVIQWNLENHESHFSPTEWIFLGILRLLECPGVTADYSNFIFAIFASSFSCDCVHSLFSSSLSRLGNSSASLPELGNLRAVKGKRSTLTGKTKKNRNKIIDWSAIPNCESFLSF